MKTLIVMPARNEAETIGAVIGRLKAIVPDADILVVNDASTDNTAEVAAKAGAKVVNLPNKPRLWRRCPNWLQVCCQT
jgi:glycosyltransferase involved in cell wall biosynthesis